MSLCEDITVDLAKKWEYIIVIIISSSCSIYINKVIIF